MNLNQLKIGQRLALLAAPLLILLVVSSGLGLFELKKADRAVEEIGHNALPSVRWLGRMADVASNYRAREFRFLVESERGRGEAVLARLAESDREMAEVRKAYEPLIADAKERELYSEFSRAWDAYAATSQKIRSFVQQAQLRAAEDLIVGEGQKARDAVIKTIEALAVYNVTESERVIEATDASAKRGVILLMVVSAAAVLVGILLSVWITRSVTRPLAQAVETAEAVARGDLSVRVRSDDGRDEVSSLLRSLASMVEALRSLVGEVHQGVGSVNTASGEIALGNQDLSRRTEAQASSLQETASAMEELTGTVRSSAEAAHEASRLAATATAVAQQGGEAVGQVVSTMGEISEASKKIAEIIGVIDGIAFQTNILALNAAVEAARAGEQGRGFAVVAGEVRNLAQRSAQAAREIKSLISDSVAKVGSGSQQVSEAGRTMDEIVERVKRVNDLIGEISGSTTEQSSGITQVNQAVAQLDQMTQQNAALVEQSAAAAQSLQDQSQKLAEAVARFRLSAA